MSPLKGQCTTAGVDEKLVEILHAMYGMSLVLFC